MLTAMGIRDGTFLWGFILSSVTVTKSNKYFMYHYLFIVTVKYMLVDKSQMERTQNKRLKVLKLNY